MDEVDFFLDTDLDLIPTPGIIVHDILDLPSCKTSRF